jgi:hypothetical protein
MENRFDFDALTKVLASGLPRREALRRLGGGLAGALLASLGLGRKAWSDPDLNSACASFCGDHCGFAKGGGNTYSQCVSSCKKCVRATGALPCGCLSRDSTGVACCTGDQFCCGGVLCCNAGQQCDSESFICS